MRPLVRRALTGTMIAIGVLVLAGWGALRLRQPSLHRNWTADNARVPQATFDGPVATVRNVRDFEWRTARDFTVRWDERRYDLRRLESVWFLVEPFGDIRGPAHTFVSFGFAGPTGGTEYVAVSVELRKEVGERYHPVRGLLREYELAYDLGLLDTTRDPEARGADQPRGTCRERRTGLFGPDPGGAMIRGRSRWRIRGAPGSFNS